MSTSAFLLFLVLAVTGAAEPGKDANARLKAHLRGWAEASDRAGPRHYTFRLTQEDWIFKEKTIWRGEVFLGKAGVLRVDVKDKSGKMEHVLFFDEQAGHLYDFGNKRELVFPIPAQRAFGAVSAPKRSFAEFIGFFFSGGLFAEIFQQCYWIYAGLPVRELEARFKLRLVHEDAAWVVLEIIPRTDSQRAHFQRLRVLLDRKAYQVHWIWMEQAGGHSNRWDFERSDAVPAKKLMREALMEDLPKAKKPTWEEMRENSPKRWLRIKYPPDREDLSGPGG